MENVDENEVLLTDEQLEQEEQQEELQEGVQEETVEDGAQTETVKTFTQEEVDRLLQQREARATKKMQKELDKTKSLIDVLKAGMGKDNTDEIEAEMRNFYKEQNIQIPDKPKYSEEEERLLAEAMSEQIISSGLEEMETTANEIARKPYSERTEREKIIFAKVVQELQYNKSKNELKAAGKDAEILEKGEFKEFAKRFNPTTNMSEIYDLYMLKNAKTVEKPKSMGSVTSTTPKSKYKDYYSPEEVDQLTEKDLDDPKIMNTVMKSMTKWK